MISRSTLLLFLIMLFAVSGSAMEPEKRKKPTSKTDPTLSMGNKQKKKLAKIKRKKSDPKRK